MARPTPIWETDRTLAAMIAAARAGGAEVRRFFRQELTIRTKTLSSDVVTQADLAAEQAILEQLKAAFPKAGIQSEEAGVSQSLAGNEWFVIDPLDGTHNFSLGIPLCAVSIARMQPRGTLTHGVIYEPLVGTTYAATVGKGAWHVESGQQLAVGQFTDNQSSTLHYCCGYEVYNENAAACNQRISDIRSISERVLINWTPATDFTLIARGATAGMISDRNELHDVAAGIVLAREAGGLVLDFEGQPASDTEKQLVIAANQTIADKLLAIVSSQ